MEVMNLELICSTLFNDDRIPRLQGGAESTLTGVAQLASTTSKQAWARPPIDIDFQVIILHTQIIYHALSATQVLMLTSSGLIVRFLKVYEKSGYQSVKWVRYLTKASSSYQVRVGELLYFGDFQSLKDLNRNCSFKPQYWLILHKTKTRE